MTKKDFLGCMGILALALSLSACSSDNNGGSTPKVNWTTNNGIKACDQILFTADGDKNVSNEGTQIGNGDDEFVFTGKQTIKKGVYTMKGWVYVTEGAELTIEPGTIIKGDNQTKAALIVERGGKIIAQGTAQEPIVFTSEEAPGSRKPGDWGGVIICGKAKNNKQEMQIEGGPRTKHGGSDDADNSGVLSYVRIEFAGNPFSPDQEINGLTLGSVGSGTKIDHIQVSYSNDDSFEWFGGSVNCDHLIAYKGWDDDFDTDNGFSGRVQFGLAVRDPKIADISQSNGFESDNNADGSNSEPHTKAVFSNITLIGPKCGASDFVNDDTYITGGAYNPGNGSSLGKFQAAMHIRRDSHLNCFNSVVVGWPIALILDNEKGNTQGAATNQTMKLQNIWFANTDIKGSDFNKIYEDHLYDYTTKATDPTKPSFTSSFLATQATDRFFDNANGWFDQTGYVPVAGSALLNAASFADAMLAGFENVTYIGAFAAGDTWATGWTNFDPQNTRY